jgi:hypothetical protein
MKLSEQLKQDHACGDFGKSLEGYGEKAEMLEKIVWINSYDAACKWGATDEKAREFADKYLNQI